jgi:hypothetical protein
MTVHYSLKPDHSCILVFQFSATLPTQNENRSTPPTGRRGIYFEKLTESAPEWTSVAKFPPPGA